jgi:hypothetical protein
MRLTYLHPQQGIPVVAEHLTELAEQLVHIPPRHSIEFLEQPFQLESSFLEQMRVCLGYEKISEKLRFSAEIDFSQVTSDILEQLARLNFKLLKVPLVWRDICLSDLADFLRKTRSLEIQVQLRLMGEPISESTPFLCELYFFLEKWMGFYTLDYSVALFKDSFISRRFSRLSRQAESAVLQTYLQRRFRQQSYFYFYQFLKLRLSHHVKTVLEINPFADEAYIRDFARQPYPWKVTLMPSLPQHALDSDFLKQLDKTFDAVVFYHGLEFFRNPQKELLLLQKYTRPTTEWALLNYNLNAAPTLIRLLKNQFENLSPYSPDYDVLQSFTQSRLKSLFDFFNIQLQFFPSRFSTNEFQDDLQKIKPLFANHLEPKALTAFDELDIVFYAAMGQMANIEDMMQPDGFISSGFLS